MVITMSQEALKQVRHRKNDDRLKTGLIGVMLEEPYFYQTGEAADVGQRWGYWGFWYICCCRYASSTATLIALTLSVADDFAMLCC